MSDGERFNAEERDILRRIYGAERKLVEIRQELQYNKDLVKAAQDKKKGAELDLELAVADWKEYIEEQQIDLFG